jgi:hypothetical protein
VTDINRAGPIGHGRRSYGLGSRDPRARREAQSNLGTGQLSENGQIRYDAQGRKQVDLDALDAELQRRGFVKGDGQ